jgi:hypothetical protein
MSERAIWQFVKYIFEKLKNEGSSYRAENLIQFDLFSAKGVKMWSCER